MKWFLLLVFVAAQAWAASPASRDSARTRAAAPPAAEERYLFVVDVSTSMRGLDRESRQAIFDLVYWGIDGHMQPGDTFGIWVVDDQLHAGDFPMQVWKSEQQLDLATKASLYIKEQRYREKANYGKLSLSLMALVMEIKDVNLFLITDAKQPLVGLTLDEQIRHACAMRAKEREARDKPFVIYLSARGGQIQSATVAIAGEPIKMPARAAAPRPPRSRSVVASEPTPKKPVGRVISLGYVDPEGLDDVRPPAGAPIPRDETQAAIQSEAGPTAGIPPSEAAVVVKTETQRTAVIPASEAAAVVKTERAQAAAMISEPAAETRPPAGTLPVSLLVGAQPAIPASPIDALTVAARESSSPPLAVAAPRPPESVLSARELFVVSGVLLLVAIGMVISFFRRLPRSAQGSYISKSMDDQR